MNDCLIYFGTERKLYNAIINNLNRSSFNLLVGNNKTPILIFFEQMYLLNTMFISFNPVRFKQSLSEANRHAA